MKLNIARVVGKKAVLAGFLIILFCCAIGATSYYYSSKTLYDSIRQSFEKRAIDDSKLLSQLLDEKLATLELLAEDDEIRSMDWSRQRKYLQKFLNMQNVTRFTIINLKGVLRSTDGPMINVSDREYFKEAVSGKPNISDVIKGRIDNQLIINVAVPITNYSGKVEGVLTYAVNYKILNELISNIKVGQNGYVILINKEGIPVAHPKQDRILSNITIFDKEKSDSSLTELADLLRKMIKGETGSGFYRYDGAEKFVAYAPVKGTNWYLGLTIPSTEMFSKIESLGITFLAETAIFILIALFMSYLILVYWNQRRNVIDLKRKADESDRNLAEVKELDRIKTEFIANISHELRTPLTVIFSSIQLFELYFKGDLLKNRDRLEKHNKAMKQNCLRLLRLINNVIDITKIEAGFQELKLKYLDIVNLIEDITSSVVEYARNKGIKLEFASNTQEKYIYCDPDILERIILNLLSNAIKFTQPDGNITVCINAFSDKVAVSVKDSGIGIPPDMQQVIFERFRQVEGTLTRNYEGSGIGLSLVKSLVEVHKGKISVSSKPGIGSDFTFELPLLEPTEDSSAMQEDHSLIRSGKEERIKVEFAE